MRFLRRTEETPRETAAGPREENKSRESRLRGRGPVIRRRLRLPEALIVLLSLAALAMLGPLRDFLAPVPALPFLAAFALFMVPGLILASALLGPNLAGPARVPVAFVLSAGVFGLAAVPELMLSKSIAFYPTICGGILALSLGFAIVRLVLLLRKKSPEEGSSRGRRPEKTDLSVALLWAPFVLLAGVLAFISASSVPRPAEDFWLYLSHVRDLLESGRLSGGSLRLALNGWLPEQSMLSLVSGLDPVPMVLRYLAPTLIVLALLALYALARTLLENEKAALVIGSLSALLFLVDFGSPSFRSVLAPGGELVNHITEDKFVARYVFLPVALSLAILFMRDRSRRTLLGLFFFVCLSVAVVHPLGLVFIGIPIAGFGLVHLAIKRRDRGAWWGIGGLWLTLLILTGPPALYLLATGSPLLSKLDSADPGVAANLIENWQYEQRLLEIGEGSYIVHPSFLLNPGMLIVYLLGVPFLIWKIKQAKEEDGSLAAQLLLGVLALVPVLTFIPYTATPISNVIGPWILHRLTWPLLLAALLTLGWMCWEALRFVGNELLLLLPGGLVPMRRVAPFLPLIVVGFLVVEAVPSAWSGIRAADASGEIAQDESSCLDPTFRWMQDAVPTTSSSGSRVMAPRLDSICMKAYSASVRPLGARGGVLPEAPLDQEAFYSAPTLGPDALQILRRRGVGYVMLPLNSPLNVQLEHLPGLFARMDNPGDKYRVYEVDQKALKEEPTPTILVANGAFNDGEWDAAIEAYTQALKGDPEDRFLAYLGLGHAYTEKEQYAKAAENYQAAVEIDPESPAAHHLLAEAYEAAGEEDRAQAEFERAIELDPENADLRLRYGMHLASADKQLAAVEQHRAVVKMYPKVPEYRVKLGAALLLAGNPEAADEQFERAVYLDPLSARLRADIGGVNRSTGRPEEALQYYEGALKLEPNSQLYALNLGRVHALLSTSGGRRDEEHFEEAEALLKRVEELGHRPWEADQREAARIALGDLYLRWDRPEDAAAAYERALELNPDSEKAKEKLKELRR